MILPRAISLVLLLALAGMAAEPDYAARRQALRQALPDAAVILFGQTAQPGEEFESGAQEPNFYYLTGWKQQGAALLMDPHREILFLPGHNARRESVWGPQAAASDPGIAEKTGFPTILPIEKLSGEVRASAGHGLRIYTIGAMAKSQIRQMLSNSKGVADPGDARPQLARLRMIKSHAELELLQHAADISIAAHWAAWKQVAAGQYEYQLAARMLSVFLDRGCERAAYPPIVAAGPDAIYLHYDRNERRIRSGELLLVDAGAQCLGYAADVTRTIPVSGKFTARQRELYEVVLGAEKAAIAAVSPGMTLRRNTPHSLYEVAYRYLNSHGKDLHGGPLGKYFTHEIGHHVGLEVHDLANADAPLEAGMVITIEPGIYIPEEQVGVRIEDMVVVTSHGGRVMTEALPKEAAEIERVLAPGNNPPPAPEWPAPQAAAK